MCRHWFRLEGLRFSVQDFEFVVPGIQRKAGIQTQMRKVRLQGCAFEEACRRWVLQMQGSEHCQLDTLAQPLRVGAESCLPKTLSINPKLDPLNPIQNPKS